MPDLGTLRTICQGEKVRLDRRPWYVFSRRVSIGITWVLLHTPVSANQVTVVSLAFTIVGPLLIAMESTTIALVGATLLVVHFFLDKVDGEIARYRRVYSLAGVYMDELSHTFAYAGTFAGVGVHLAWGAATMRAALEALIPAMLGALAMVMIRQNKSMGSLLFAQNVLEQPALLPPESAAPAPLLSREGVRRGRRGEADGGSRSFLASIVAAARDVVLVISEFTVVLLLVIAGLVVQAVTGDARFLSWVLCGQAVLQLAVLAAIIWINRSFNLETEVRRLNELVAKRAKEEPRLP